MFLGFKHWLRTRLQLTSLFLSGTVALRALDEYKNLQMRGNFGQPIEVVSIYC